MKQITKKKKIDFQLLRKLEDEYDDAVEDTERKERILLESVYDAFLKVEPKGKTEFFKGLQKSEPWYRTRWDELETISYKKDFIKSELRTKDHQERKVQSIVKDLDEMEEETID